MQLGNKYNNNLGCNHINIAYGHYDNNSWAIIFSNNIVT